MTVVAASLSLLLHVLPPYRPLIHRVRSAESIALVEITRQTRQQLAFDPKMLLHGEALKSARIQPGHKPSAKARFGLATFRRIAGRWHLQDQARVDRARAVRSGRRIRPASGGAGSKGCVKSRSHAAAQLGARLRPICSARLNALMLAPDRADLRRAWLSDSLSRALRRALRSPFGTPCCARVRLRNEPCSSAVCWAIKPASVVDRLTRAPCSDKEIARVQEEQNMRSRLWFISALCVGCTAAEEPSTHTDAGNAQNNVAECPQYDHTTTVTVDGESIDVVCPSKIFRPVLPGLGETTELPDLSCLNDEPSVVSEPLDAWACVDIFGPVRPSSVSRSPSGQTMAATAPARPQRPRAPWWAVMRSKRPTKR